MKINAAIVDDYLNGVSSDRYSDSWVFNEIEKGEHLFDEPDRDLAPKVQEIRDRVDQVVNSFIPFNYKIWSGLFPESQKRLESVFVQLVVGCPSPYEAMVREDLNHREVIIFDLIRFNRYGSLRASEIVRAMLTHECAHILLHQDYPENSAASYKDKMKFLLFDEGLAHFLALSEDVEQYDWNNKESMARKKESFHIFNEVIQEQDKNRQKIFLRNACSGHFWEKFACITGMFLWSDTYASSGIKGVKTVYEKGWKNFSNTICWRKY
ncbi:hypothetical protein E4665_11335 [Sporolactobacillus shoreae]|uniref:DUF2268 domain-containing protein n=1 Tax=Sporolactobacillus shoreae TaxID=1465501 RepID=A0A4Z0GNZ1_9BACL|nr:DUF5700 domain-containing putative Zn-dependent protease [Sporolactobacillus shoreae]TGA97688.1 hypothetical protein E4665_11335 [Sporolactobacillus shoreae]